MDLDYPSRQERLGFDCSQETKDQVAHIPFTEYASKQAGAGPIIFAKEKSKLLGTIQNPWRPKNRS